MEVGQGLVLGQTGRGDGLGQQRVVDTESGQSSYSHSHSASTLPLNSLTTLTTIISIIITINNIINNILDIDNDVRDLVVVVVVPHPPGDGEDQWRRHQGRQAGVWPTPGTSRGDGGTGGAGEAGKGTRICMRNVIRHVGS